MVTYPRRPVVGRDGDEFPEIGVILAGNVHLSHIDSNGNSNLMDVLSAGATLGELNSVGRYRLHVTITATAQTEILYLSVDRLLRKNVLTAPTQIRFLQNLTLAVASKGQYLTRKLETASAAPPGNGCRITCRPSITRAGQPYLCDPAQTGRTWLISCLWTAAPCPTSCARCGMRGF